MRNRYSPGWNLALFAIALLAGASAAWAQPCCECRCPRNEARACSAAFGVDDEAYLGQVCEPLGCTIAVCTSRSCSQSNRCPDEETGRCADGFDNDADGHFDCDDADCEDDEGCSGNPTPMPTTPSGGTPGASPTATPGRLAVDTSERNGHDPARLAGGNADGYARAGGADGDADGDSDAGDQVLRRARNVAGLRVAQLPELRLPQGRLLLRRHLGHQLRHAGRHRVPGPVPM